MKEERKRVGKKQQHTNRKERWTTLNEKDTQESLYRYIIFRLEPNFLESAPILVVVVVVVVLQMSLFRNVRHIKFFIPS